MNNILNKNPRTGETITGDVQENKNNHEQKHVTKINIHCQYTNRNFHPYFNRHRNYKRKWDRDRLPTPACYYSHQFPGLKIKSEWVNVRCCFHEDKFPSLSLHMISGGFHCFACGVKGGDIISFQMKRYEMTFVEAVSFFGAWV